MQISSLLLIGEKQILQMKLKKKKAINSTLGWGPEHTCVGVMDTELGFSL